MSSDDESTRSGLKENTACVSASVRGAAGFSAAASLLVTARRLLLVGDEPSPLAERTEDLQGASR